MKEVKEEEFSQAHLTSQDYIQSLETGLNLTSLLDLKNQSKSLEISLAAATIGIESKAYSEKGKEKSKF